MPQTIKVSASGNSWTRKYSENEGRTAAFEAVRYLGLRRSLIIARAIRSDLYPEEKIRLFCSFGGVQGRPVTELMKIFSPKD